MRKLTPIALAIILAGCSDDDENVQILEQPIIQSKVHALLNIDGLIFRDSNGNSKLEPFEDWRLTPEQRSEDIVKYMTLEEKAGMMLIETMNADWGGSIPLYGMDMIKDNHMTRFIFRNPVVAEPNKIEHCGDPAQSRAGCEISPRQAAEFTNATQLMREQSRMGIPALFKSNARNHIDPSAKAGINVTSGSFSAFPKEAGLAATRDMELIKQFATIMNDEWSSIGLRSMYGYMMDLATEPRWYRVHETFTEDAYLAADIMENLIIGLQGNGGLSKDSIALTVKHFPGGGPQEEGGDPHYEFGKNQIYTGNNFDYHLIPFQAAIDAGASSIMPYYGIPVDQEWKPNDVGMSFSKGIVTDLLRGKMGYTGNVNSDTGIIGDRAWGVATNDEGEQIAMSINAGVDVLSGYKQISTILDIIGEGENQLTENRIDLSVRRLVKEQFQLGLFENPYVDPDLAEATLGKQEYQDFADRAQQKSVVLLSNGAEDATERSLPLTESVVDNPIKIYTMGMDAEIVSNYGYDAVSGDYIEGSERPSALAFDYAIIRVRVSNKGAQPELYFGGANPDELSKLSFTEMETAASWDIQPSLADIKAVMAEVGADNTVLSINFRQPFVVDDESNMREAGAMLATFGVSDRNLMEVLVGNTNPQGKLPFALANSAQAILDQNSDEPGYPDADTLYPFGHGLSY